MSSGTHPVAFGSRTFFWHWVKRYRPYFHNVSGLPPRPGGHMKKQPHPVLKLKSFRLRDKAVGILRNSTPSPGLSRIFGPRKISDLIKTITIRNKRDTELSRSAGNRKCLPRRRSRRGLVVSKSDICWDRIGTIWRKCTTELAFRRAARHGSLSCI